MISTKDETTEMLSRFFKEKIAPLAKQLAASNEKFFPLKSEDLETYFEDYKPYKSELVAETDLLSETSLKELWAGEHAALLVLAEGVTQIAKALEAQPESERQLSAYVYAMY